MKRKITAEIILILASVLIFRSTWTLLDMNPIMNEQNSLIISLIFGVIVTIWALYYLFEKENK
ncbi:MAG: hypothetical protein PWQ56_144 [Patescibacteria group bacterium]|nr:hypothetical protein [Patescibacteria group bacterium]